MPKSLALHSHGVAVDAALMIGPDPHGKLPRHSVSSFERSGHFVVGAENSHDSEAATGPVSHLPPERDEQTGSRILHHPVPVLLDFGSRDGGQPGDGGGGVGPFHPAVRQRAGRRMPFATEANEESFLRLPDVGMFPVPVRIGRVRLRVDPLAKIRTHGVQATGNERRAGAMHADNKNDHRRSARVYVVPKGARKGSSAKWSGTTITESEWVLRPDAEE